MSVNRHADIITLTGACGVEEVDLLVQYLESSPKLSVDISAATAMHTALWQALMVFKSNIIGKPISSSTIDVVFRAVSRHIDEARAL